MEYVCWFLHKSSFALPSSFLYDKTTCALGSARCRNRWVQNEEGALPRSRFARMVRLLGPAGHSRLLLAPPVRFPAPSSASVRPMHSDEKLSKKRYKKELKRLRIELRRLQKWVKMQGMRVVLVFEGRDAAGQSLPPPSPSSGGQSPGQSPAPPPPPLPPSPSPPPGPSQDCGTYRADPTSVVRAVSVMQISASPHAFASCSIAPYDGATCVCVDQDSCATIWRFTSGWSGTRQ